MEVKRVILLLILVILLQFVEDGESWRRRRRRRRCSPRNCYVSGWSGWSRCTHACGSYGTRYRTRYVTQGAWCGGSCPYSLRETVACNRGCCPVNCISTWGVWGACQGCGRNGRQTRTLRISRNPSCGGTVCPSTRSQTRSCIASRCCPVNCAVSSWGSWGSCNAQCEKTGIRSRTRRVTTAASCNGTPCPQLTQHNSCNGPCCRRDCVLSSWTSVGSCTAPAGACSTNSGRLTQRRTVVTAQSCGGTCPALQRTISCTPVPIQCQVSNWGAWGTCTLKSGSCGAGTQARTRTITTQPYCAPSCPATSESRDCVHSCCPVDCVLSQWTAWGTCSANCGLGSQIRTRRVQTPASCNGRCSSVLSQTQSCTVTRKIDCQLSPWTAWSICSSGCGNGIQQRSRTVTVRPTPCGQQCGSLSGTKQCQSYRENRDCQVGNWMAWQQCDSNCSYGTKERFRTVTVAKRCNGAVCPTLKDTAACGLPNGGCEQLCRTSDGACSCFAGYKSTNRTHCTLKDCGQPAINYCPSGEANGTVCKQPWVTCPNGRTLFRSSCTVSCPPTYRLKGLGTISCEADGGWTKGFGTTYCRRINDPASDIILSGSNSVPENSPSKTLVGSLSSVDVNPKDNHTYAVVPGRSYAGKFELIGNELYTLVTFDYETGPKSYSIGITSTDNGTPSLSFTKYITVSIDDVNEEPTNIILSSLEIGENSDIGTVVGLLDTTDVDIGQKNTYTLIDSANGMFRVNNNALQAARPNMQCLQLGSPRCPFNYEQTTSYVIEVLSSDDKSPSFNITRQFNITVTNRNDPPYDVKITGNTVKENDPNGTIVGKLSATDEDRNPAHSMTFSLVDDDNGRFGVTRNGDVFKTEGIDYEKDQSHTIQVRVTDNGTPPASNIENVTIIVLDVNEPPVNITITPAQPIIVENAAIGTVIGEIEAYDSDFITSLNLTLDIDAGGRFKVESNASCSKTDDNDGQVVAKTVCKAKLMVNGELNFERSNVHTISVRAEDRGHFIHRLFKIQITDANDPPHILRINGKSFADVPENSLGATIGVLATLDEDANQTHTFSLVDDTNDMLVIEDETLKLNVNQSYNYETRQSYTVQINVTDDGIPQASALFPIIIKVTNVNEAPTDIRLSADSIEENSLEGATVANITVVDPDDVISNSTTRYHTCTLLDSAGGRFKVLNGLTVAVGSGELNYEQTSNHTITVQCSDGALTVSKSFTITVTDVNEKPSQISLSANKVPENLQSRYLIGYLSTVDPDNIAMTTQSFTYGIRGNDSRFNVTGNALYGVTPFDFEVGSVVYAKVSSTDNGSPPLTKLEDIRVEVTDVNDVPNDIVISSNRVDENSPLDTMVGTLSTVDQDLNQDFTYNLVDSADGRFKIQNGIVKVAVSNSDCLRLGGTHCSLNFESMKSHVIQIRTTDDGSPPLSFTKNLTIYLKDVNDRPRDIRLSNYTVPETAPVNHVIGKFTVSDEDNGQTVAYTLTTDDEGHFGVDNGGNLYKASNKTNFETSKSHKITVKITDNGSPSMSISKNFTIEVLDVNEAPIITKITNENGQLKFQENKPEVEENSQKGTVIGTIVSYESEAIDKIVFSLDDNADGVFTLGRSVTCRNVSNVVGARSMCSVQLILNDNVNFETKASYSILIRSTDSQGLFHVQQFSVEIVDKNDAPTGILIGGQKYAIVSENQPGTLVDDMTTTDEDSSQSHVYALLGNNSAMFNIYKSYLFLSRGTGFDYEQQTVHKIMLNSTDSGKPPLSVVDTLELRVRDVNEAPTKIALDGNAVLENSPRGTVIGNLSVTDPDNMGSKGNWQYHTCSVSSGGAGLLTVQDLKLVVAHSGLDYEKVPTLNISIRCEDSGRPVQSIEKWFIISVHDVNERPTSISISNSFVAENTPPGGIGMLSTRDPDNSNSLNFRVQSFTYSFVNIDASVPFEISGNILRTTKQLDFENQSSWILNIRSADDGNPSLSVDNIVVINVTDVNEQPTDIALSSPNVNENAALGTKIGLLTTSDPDRGQSFSYSLVDSANGLFRVSNSQVEVAVNNKVCLSRGGDSCRINYERQRNIDIRVQSKDSGNPQLSIEKVITIQVNDVNDKPGDLQLSANNLPENATKGFLIGQLTVTDEDAGQNVTFRLTNDDNGRFTVNNDGFIVKAKDTNYENQKIHKITVEASDNGSPVLKVSKDFVIIVQDVNEAPTKIEITSERGQIAFPKNSAHVNENSAKGVIVGTFYAHDEDAVEKLTFSLDDNANGSFSVANPASCSNTTANGKSKQTVCKALLMVAGAIDFETDATKSIIVRVTDNKGLSYSQLFTVITIDKNDRPTDIWINGLYNGFVNENQDNTLIGTLQTQDEDAGQRHSYRILNGPDVTFIISGGKLYTSPHAALNYERKSKYTLLVETIDNGSPSMSYQRNLTVQVLDVNEAPTAIQLTSNVVNENSAIGTLIGNVTVSDPDNEGKYAGTQKASCQIITDTSGMFEIRKDVQLVVKKASLNFERISSYSIKVRCSDNGIPSKNMEQSLTINVNDVNEAPTSIILTNGDIRENVPSATVGRCVVSDPDRTRQTFVLRVTDNSLPFKMFGNVLKTTRPLNYEQKHMYKMSVMAIDQGGLNVTENFTVNVQDVNDRPSNILFNGALEIQENSNAGVLVAIASAVDEDFYQVHRYVIQSIVGFGQQSTRSLPGYFTIGSTTGRTLSATSAIDHEEFKAINISVTATDNGRPAMSVTKVVTIRVTDVNHPPTDIIFNGRNIKENSPLGYVVGNFTVVDPDNKFTEKQTFTCNIQSNDVIPFKISRKISLTVDGVVDYEKKQSYVIRVLCVEDHLNPYNITKSFVVNVLNINEAPTGINITANTVAENQDPGAFIGTISAVDPDNKVTYVDNVTIQLLPELDGASFRLVDGNSLITNQKFNYEQKNTFNIKIRASDNGQPALSSEQILNILVTDVNDRPTDIMLSSKIVAENAVQGTIVGQLSTTDEDAGQTYVYSFINTIDNLSIHGNKILVAGKLDYETEPQINIIIRVTDSGNPALTYQKSFNITVTDANDPPSDIIATMFSVPENNTVNKIIANLKLVDEDRYQHVRSCSMIGNPGDFYFQNGASSDEINMLIRGTATLDYETAPNINVTVQCFDNGRPSLSIQKKISIQVVDSNDKPTGILINGSTILKLPENSPIESVVGPLSCIDQDAGQSHQYQLQSGGDIFMVQEKANLLLVKNNSKLDYEKLPSSKQLPVSIKVTDNGHPSMSFTSTIQIDVTDVNEAPSNVRLIHTLSDKIPENVTIGIHIGELFADNPEGFRQQLTYSILNWNDTFAITESHGPGKVSYLTVKGELNFDLQTSYNLTVMVTDNGIPALSAQNIITINVERTDPCYSGALDCGSEICQRINKTHGNCGCLAGYEPKKGVCVQIDDCKSNCLYCEDSKKACQTKIKCPACYNNATCVDKLMSYKCSCLPGFTDDRCETNIDDCASKPCQYGTCFDLLNNYRCECNEGYEGRNCETNIDECKRGECVKADCTDLVAGFSCGCQKGATGLLCNRREPDCVPNPCGQKRCVAPAYQGLAGLTKGGKEVLCASEEQATILGFAPAAVPDDIHQQNKWKYIFREFIMKLLGIPFYAVDLDEEKSNGGFYSPTDVVMYPFSSKAKRSLEATDSKKHLPLAVKVQNKLVPRDSFLRAVNKTCANIGKSSKYWVYCEASYTRIKELGITGATGKRTKTDKSTGGFKLFHGNNLYMFIGGAAGLVLIIAIILMVVARRRRSAAVRRGSAGSHLVPRNGQESYYDAMERHLAEKADEGTFTNPMYGDDEDEVRHRDRKMFENPLYGARKDIYDSDDDDDAKAAIASKQDEGIFNPMYGQVTKMSDPTGDSDC